jgi:hypothetical protein
VPSAEKLLALGAFFVSWLGRFIAILATVTWGVTWRQHPPETPTTAIQTTTSLSNNAATFRPRAHRLLGVALIGLHLSIALTMNIWFLKNVLLIAILLVNSPFTNKTEAIWLGIRDLPLFQLVYRRWVSKTPAKST